MQDSRLIETAVESRLMQLLTRDLGQAGDSGIHEDAQFVRIDQLVVALGSDVAKSSAALENQIRGWLKQQGWKHGKKQIAGARLPGYYRPDVWPPVAAVVGLDQIDRDSQAQEADAPAAPPQAPAGQAQAEPSAPLSPASQWVRDQANDDTPF
jgi:hypothetical protein